MYLDRYGRQWIGAFPFTTAGIAQASVPANSGVYQILYKNQLVYVGISTSSIRDRLTKHVAGHGNWAVARRMDNSNYTFGYFLCDATSARQIESFLLTSAKPPYNDKIEYKHYISNITVH